MIYYNYATLYTNESHIQEYFCVTYVSIGHTDSVTLVESVAWSETRYFFLQREVRPAAQDYRDAVAVV